MRSLRRSLPAVCCLTLGAMASAIVMVFGINLVHRTTRPSGDTGICLLTLLSLTVVTSFRVVGALLVFG